MKLHLPSRLRSALLACMALLSPIVPSVSGVAFFVHSHAEAVDYIAESKTKQNITCGTGGATSGTDLTTPSAQDTITFKVSAGYLFDARSGTADDHTIKAKLKIESLVMNDGYSGGGTTAWYYFTGSVSGSGPITRTAAQDSLGFSFSGDMSGYYGNITINGGGGTDPTLDYDNILKLGNITVGTEGLAGSITINKNARLQLEGTTIWGDVSSVKTEISGTLKTAFKGNFINEGSLINDGVLVVYGGEFTNKGALINTGSISFVNSNSQVDSVGSITNSGTLNLGSKLSISSAITNTGTINAATGGTLVSIDDLSNFFSEGTGTFSDGKNGYFSGGAFSIFSGGNVSGTFTAQYKDGEVVSVEGGKATFQSSADDQGVYWINDGTVTYDGSPATGDGSIADATKLQLNGGTLKMTSSLKDQVSQGIGVSNNSTIQLDGTDVVLNKSSVTVDTGKTLSLTGRGNYVIASPGAVVTLGTGVQLGADWMGTVTISGGSSTTGSDFSALVKDQNSVLEFNGVTGWDSKKWNGENSYNVKLTNDGNNKAWVNGAYSINGASATFSGKWSGTGTFVAKIGASGKVNPIMNYTYSGDISEWTGLFEMEGFSDDASSVLTFTGMSGSVNAAIRRIRGSLSVVASTDASFSNSVMADTFTVSANKTATFSGAGKDYNIGTVAGDGTLKVTDGILTLTTLSGKLTFAGGGYKGGTITVGDSAILTIDGTVKVASLAQLTAADSTIPTGNGYVTATYTLATGEESTISATGAKAVVGGVEYALAHSSDTKALTFSTDGSSGTYYVNTDSVNYDNAANATTNPPYTVDIDAGKATGIVLNGDNVTLNMHLSLSSVAVDKISVKNNATINLAKSDVVLNKSDVTVDAGKTLTLTGSGNYVIASPGAAITLGTWVQLGADWTGTVTISGGQNGSFFVNLVNGTKSTLEFNGVTGWSDSKSTASWAGEQSFNVKLTDNGTTKAWVCGAYPLSTAANATGTFSGKWSGDGTFQTANAGPKRMDYTYTGNISEWTGTFEKTGNGETILTFTGAANSINATILHSAGSLTIVADTDATFSKSVTADAVTVNAGKSAVFKGTLTTTTLTANAETTLSGTGSVIDTLAGTGKLLVSGGTTEVTSALAGGTAVEVTGGTLTLAGGTAEGSGSVTVKSGGTLTLAGGTAEGSGSVTVKSGGTLSLKGGADAAVETSFASDTVTLEKGGVLTCSGDSVLKGTVAGSGTLKVNKDTTMTIRGDVMLGGTITNEGELILDTDTEGAKISFTDTNALQLKGGTNYTDDKDAQGLNNGYVTEVRYVVDGTAGSSLSLSEVTIGDKTHAVLWNSATGDATINIKENGGLYYITEGKISDRTALVYDTASTSNSAASNNTEGLVLNGGDLYMKSSLNGNAVRAGIKVEKDATISVAAGVAVDNIALTVNDEVTLTLDGTGDSLVLDAINGTGSVSSDKKLLVDKGGNFTGSYDGNVRIGTSAEGALQKLRAGDKLTVIGDAGTVEVTGLTSTDPDTPNVLGGIATTGASVKLDNKTDAGAPTKVTLDSASSMNGGETGCELEFTVSAAQVNANLAADKADKPTVITGKKLDLTNVTLKVNEVDNMGFAYNTDGPEKDILLFVVSDNTYSTVNNVTVDMSGCSWMSKYFTNFRVVEGSVNVVADANTGIYASHGQTPNGTAGLALAGKVMFRLNPQTLAPDRELAQVLDMLDNHVATGNTGAMDRLGAALAGSSLSAVGMAVSDDVQRQLRAIRNRTTTMGVNECVVNEDMPYVNGWISGDGNYRQLSESGTDAGYQVSSWGGTVGVDVDVNPNLTLGVAVSALFGDYTGKAADTLTGNLDTQYVSLFARVSTGSWVNTFVGTLGRADVDLERTLPGIAGKTTYKTNGMMFGFLYEIARTFALNEDASTCVQPLFNMSFTHTSLDSATEGGAADTRLTTDSASLTQFSLGLGGRLQSIVGENEYNRASIFEARALLKLDFGDRYNKLNTALAALPDATVTTRSNESGVIGAEVGATLTIPLSQDAGSVFFDVNADFRADQTGVNGSVGYRINF